MKTYNKLKEAVGKRTGTESQELQQLDRFLEGFEDYLHLDNTNWRRLPWNPFSPRKMVSQKGSFH